MDIIIGLPDGKDRESNPSLTGHSIEEVKRTPPEEFQNVEGARLDLSGEFTTIRDVKCGRALDGCGISAELENKLKIKMELESNPSGHRYSKTEGTGAPGRIR